MVIFVLSIYFTCIPPISTSSEMEIIIKWIIMAALLPVASLAETNQGENSGQRITIRVQHSEVDKLYQCVLPSSLKVKAELKGQRETPELVLSKSSVVAGVSAAHQVKIMKKDTEGFVRSHHLAVHETEVLGTEAYHNHTTGAAFVVRCVLLDSGRMYFKLDGSIYLYNSKYRVSPVLTEVGEDHIEFESHWVAAMYSMTPVQEHNIACNARSVQYRDEESDTSRNTLPLSTLPIDTNQSKESHRYQRETTTYYVDVLPVVDYSLYARWLDIHQNATNVKILLNNYLLITLTAVDMRLQTLALGNINLRVRIVTPVISTEPEASPYTEDIKFEILDETRVSAPILLQTFSDWIASQTTLPPHDHAMLFTSYDLVPSTNPQEVQTNVTKGLANVAALCQNGSVSLIEDKGAFQSENVAAHELGHGLGSKHDGEDNQCRSADRYLMASGTFPQTSDNLLHPWVFSSCSSAAILTYIRSLEQQNSALNDCLLRQEGQPADLGLTLTAQSVCERFYGNTSFPCRNFDNFTEICTILRCRTLEDAVCILVVPPTGTCCGDQMQCDAGTCVDAPQGECPTDEECPLGDQPSIPLESSSTTCDQLSPAFCYIDEVRNYCCDTCRSHRTNNLNCTYGDRKDCSAVTDASRCFDQTLATDCCGTCARLTASPITMPTTSTTPSAGPPSTEAITTSTASPTTQAATTNDGPPVDSTNTASLTTADPNTNTVVSRPRTTPSTSTTNQRMTLATQVTTKRESQNGDRPQNGYGYKPDGFEGCYLPPCSAHALFQKIVVSAIILVCLCLVRKIVDM